MPGFPPEEWIRAKATSKDRTESPTHDFCSRCAQDVNLHDVAATGRLIEQPKATTKKGVVSRAKLLADLGEDLDSGDPGE